MKTANFTPEQQSFIQKQQLGESELLASIDGIIEKLKLGVVPSDRPIAVIVGGQCGAGKSGVIGNTLEKLNSNCVTIDNDNYRYAHPNLDEINSTHPEIFTECTDQLSFSATPKVIASMIDGRYNMIIHQTLKNDTIVRCAMTDLLKAGYTVVVRALAVDKITSIKDELGRGQKELALGKIPRWVPPENHDTAYNGLPGTVELIENQGKYHMLEVVTRSEDKNDLNNIGVIYRVINSGTSLARIIDLEGYGFSTEKIKNHSSAKAAVENGRAQDASKTMATIDEDLSKMKAVATTPEEQVRIKRIEDIVEEYTLSGSKRKQNGEE